MTETNAEIFKLNYSSRFQQSSSQLIRLCFQKICILKNTHFDSQKVPKYKLNNFREKKSGGMLMTVCKVKAKVLLPQKKFHASFKN